MKKLHEATEKKKASEEKDNIFDWIECVVFALVFCILIFTFLTRTVGVVGSSMVPTLEDKERLLISNIAYTPKYGDIVILRKDTYASYPLVKRVIATEGQTIDINFDEGIVYVDNEPLQEDYTASLTYVREDFTEPVTVPEGCVFVMGDNRNKSTDSRTAEIGCVDTRYILGRVFMRITPVTKFKIF